MDDSPPPEYATDEPLFNKSDDRLNRAAFAERVASVLVGLPEGASLVVGIHGPWGDGKTTVLNLLRDELGREQAPVVRDFNPWRLTDEDAMLRQFFAMLADAIGESLHTQGERARATAGKWVRRLRWITKPAGWFSKSAESIDDLLSRFAEGALRGDTVAIAQLRSRIIERLGKSDRRIIVLVDDIDRLDKNETRTLFRVIKACASFPNVCYVLAFDDVVVARSLGEQYGSGDEASGRAFLEKIIQIPLKLPVAMKEDLRSLCFEQIDRAIASAGIELSEAEVGEFVSGFDRGVSIRLDTPRAAKRFGNALMFALPMLRGEVNTVDLLLLEAVRAFYPGVYDSIRENHADFSGVEPEHGGRRRDEVRAVALMKPVLAGMNAEEQEAVKRLLRGMFPRLGSAFGGSGYGSDWLGPWAKKKRICSPDYCPRYFSYAVPRSDVSDSVIDDLCKEAATGDGGGLDDDLVAFFTTGKARRVIERLRQRESEIPVEAAATMAMSIARTAKHIPNPPSLFSFSEPPSQAAMLVSSLIQALPEGAERVTLAKRVVEVADPLWFGDECLRWVYVTDEPDKAEHNTLTKEQVNEVRLTLVDRVKQRSADGDPLFDVRIPQECSLLHEWSRAEGREPVQAHLTAIFERDPSSIGAFLQAMAPRAWGEGDVVPRVGDLDGNQLKNIKLLYDLDDLAALIQRHLPGDFENPQWFPDSNRSVERQLAEQFVHVLKKWNTEGEPPDRAADQADADSGHAADKAAEEGDDAAQS